NILEMRRATKAAPLLPPKAKRQPEVTDSKKQGPKEIVDINVKIRGFHTNSGTSNTIMCLFSESDDTYAGPWKVSTTSEVLNKEANIDLLSVFAIEFQFERCQYIKLDICDWSENSVTSLG
uniref:MATH domain-containing protein n=1 Tax=Panagrolaimus sp. PS1159 TaxID=55785 RepID=A0AC35GEH4_9BILA